MESYFTPYNQATLNSSDADLGSGAPLVLPDSVGSISHPHLVVGGGKKGTLYMADRDSLGVYSSSTDNIVEEQVSAVGPCYSSAAYYNGKYYVVADGKVGNAFPIATGSFSTALAVATPDTFGFPAASPCVSGSSANDPNAVIWCLDGNGSNQLRAYLASNFNQEIYTSAQAANNRDATGSVCKFAVPTIANSRVYVPTANGLIGYGLLSASAPPAPGNLIAAALDNGTIWLSWAPGSANQSAFYIEQSSDGTQFAQVATTGGTALTFPVTALTSGSTYYFRIRAYNAVGFSNYSNIASATLGTTQPAIDFASGFSNSGSVMALKTNGAGSIPPNTTQLQMLTPVKNEAHSAWYSTLVNVSEFTTEFDFQVTGSEPLADGITFTLQRSGTTALGGTGGSHGFSGISNAVGIDFTVYKGSYAGIYGVGTETDVNAAAGINYHTGDMMRVLLTYDGTTLAETITDLATNAVFTKTFSINIPGTIGGNTAYVGFTGGTGGSTSTQNILNWIYSTVPLAPGNLTTIPNSDTQVTLTWVNNATSDSGYEIDRANESSFTVNPRTFSIPAVTSSTGTYADSGLTANTTYFYRVRAFNNVGNSAYSGTASVLTYCAAPTGPDAIGGNGIVSMAWNASSGASSYKLFRGLMSGSEGPTAYQAGIVSTTATDSSATNGVTYFYTVSAVNGSGAGPQSVEFAAVPSATPTFGQWQLQEFGSVLAAESTAAGAWANPAGDGIVNLFKYALNLHALVPGQSGLPVGSTAIIGGTNYLTLRFVRPHPAPGDITYDVETSETLSVGSWTPGVMVSGYPVSNGDGTESVEERSAAPVQSPSEFIRLRLTQP